MRRLPFLLITLSCLSVFAGDYLDEQIIDSYDESNQTYGETYARLTYVGKYATVFHEGRVEEPAVRNLPIVSGDLLETGNSTYSELEFIDGSLLQVADRTKLEAQAINEVYSNESLTVFRLHEGQIFLHVSDKGTHNRDQVFRIDSRAGSAYIEAPGIYMLSYRSGRLKLKTYRGLAELSGEYGSALVHSGEFSSIRGMGKPVGVVAFNSFRGNKFERWAYDRRPIHESSSARYVDNAISTYSRDLDDHGEWRYSRDYDSHVWVPYTRKEWRPYHNGYWSPISGRLTWVSYDPFGYVTHHYGRWGWSLSFGWHWVPGRYYSPAWVAWSTYDSYIGWCPLGYYNRPFYYGSKSFNTVIINNYNNRWNYISIRDVNTRRAVRISHRNYARQITTRPISLVQSDLRDGRRVARVIRDPQLNQRRYSERVSNRGYILNNQRAGRDSRVSIQRRDTGTRAASRYATTTREIRQQRLRSQGSTIVERSTQTRSRETARSQASPSRRQSEIKRTQRSNQSSDRATATRRSGTIKRTQRQPTTDSNFRRERQSTRSSAPKQRSRATTSKERSQTQSRAPQRLNRSGSATQQRQRSQTQAPSRRSSSRAQPTQRQRSTQRQSNQRRSETRSAPPKQRQRATKPPQRRSQPRTSTAPKQRQRTNTPSQRRSQPRTSTAPKQRQRTNTPSQRRSQPRTSTAPKQRQRTNASRSSSRQRTQTRTAPKRQSSRPMPKPVPKRDNK